MCNTVAACTRVSSTGVGTPRVEYQAVHGHGSRVGIGRASGGVLLRGTETDISYVAGCCELSHSWVLRTQSDTGNRAKQPPMRLARQFLLSNQQGCWRWCASVVPFHQTLCLYAVCSAFVSRYTAAEYLWRGEQDFPECLKTTPLVHCTSAVAAVFSPLRTGVAEAPEAACRIRTQVRKGQGLARP